MKESTKENLAELGLFAVFFAFSFAALAGTFRSLNHAGFTEPCSTPWLPIALWVWTAYSLVALAAFAASAEVRADGKRRVLSRLFSSAFWPVLLLRKIAAVMQAMRS